MAAPDRTHIRDLLAQASELPADQRAVFLSRACGQDTSMRREVESLLAVLDQAGQFLAPPVADRPCPTTGLLDTPDGAEVRLDPESHDPGTTINHYRVLQLIGEGGFGRVYLAEQERPVKRQVALKIIKPGMDTRQVIKRFKAERQALAMMDHPNIAKVLDAGSTEAGRPYFVMELVRGMPITEYCDAVSLSVRERLELFVKICSAVQHAHQKGIIHRDIKPSNVLVTMVDGTPVPKVIDFGVAKATNASLGESAPITEHRQWMGTPQYMSPEQAGREGGDIDTRSDIYSLGVLLYELLTGSTPFDSRDLRQSTQDEVQRVIREVEPRRPSITIGSRSADIETISLHRGTDARRLSQLVKGELDWIVMRCLEKDRARRYETASGLARDVEHYLRGEPVQAGPPSGAYRVRKFVRRHKALIATTGIVLAASILGTIGTSIGLLRAIHERDASTRSQAKATQEAAKAAALNNFLLNMLGSADPQLSKGKDVLVRDILDQAAQEVKLNPPTDPETHEAIEHTLGTAYQALGIYGIAADHLRVSLNLRSKKYGPQSLEAARAMGELADSLWDDLEYAAAEPFYRQSLQIRQTLLGLDNAEVAASMQSVANMLQGKGDYEGAYENYQHALAIRRKIFSEDNLDIARNLVGLAVLYRDDGKRDQAKGLVEEALRIQRKLLGDKDLRVADTLVVLGSVSGATSESVDSYQHALTIQKQVLGPDHPRVAVTLTFLARKMEDLNNFGDEPEFLLREALRINRQAFGQRHGEVARSLERLGELYLGRKAWPQAQQTLQQSLAMLRQTLGEDAPEVGWVVRDLVPVFIAQKEFADAETMLLARYQWSTRQPEPRFRQEVAQMLVNLYQAWGKPDKAAQWSAALSKPAN
jgi:tetratricopeptide (TPR) repeat protein/tRNA A-37 threonylcarbamoyl transferase component Bud32